MTNLKNRIDDFLTAAQVMIQNSLTDSVVKTALAEYGYDEARLQAGKALYDKVAALQASQKKESGDQAAATAGLDTLWEEADQMYMKTLKVARVALKGNEKAGKAILLYGDRKQSFSGWLEQVRIFYTNISGNPEIMNLMAQYGYTPEKIQKEFEAYNRVADQQARRKKEIGEAQAATAARDKALDELAGYISGLRIIARVALENDPQQLEKLGILARSDGYRPKKKQGEEGNDEKTPVP